MLFYFVLVIMFYVLFYFCAQLGEACIHAGCKYGHTDVIQYLVSIRTNLDLQDHVSFIFLCVFLSFNTRNIIAFHFKICKLLSASGNRTSHSSLAWISKDCWDTLPSRCKCQNQKWGMQFEYCIKHGIYQFADVLGRGDSTSRGSSSWSHWVY